MLEKNKQNFNAIWLNINSLIAIANLIPKLTSQKGCFVLATSNNFRITTNLCIAKCRLGQRNFSILEVQNHCLQLQKGMPKAKH